MTTKSSSLRVLKQQADKIASLIMAAERGERIDAMFSEKIEAARGKDAIKVAIVMDDKVVTIEMLWTVIRSTGQVGLAEYILHQMRETRRTLN